MTDKQIIDLTKIDQKYKDKCSLIKAGKCKNVNIFIEQSRKFEAKEKECNELKSKLAKSFADERKKEIKIDQLKQALKEIKNLASCGKDMYMERGKYENYEAMAEWMKNQFYFILNKISEVE